MALADPWMPFLFNLNMAKLDSLGFRFGDVAYTPDLNAIPKESLAYLEGLDLWIVDALRYTPHPSHFCLPETLELDRAIAAAAGGSDQSSHRSRFRTPPQANCPPMSNRLSME